MMNFLSDDLRRDPYPLYEQVRSSSPLLHEPESDMWLVFDYESVKRVMTDHGAFSSIVTPPTGKTPDWLVFSDPPRHTKLRGIIMRAFTPGSTAIEEVLRYRSPGQIMFRSTKRDIELHGQVIPAGKLVLVMIGSANRDPLKFHDPDRFDTTLRGRRPAPLSCCPRALASPLQTLVRRRSGLLPRSAPGEAVNLVDEMLKDYL